MSSCRRCALLRVSVSHSLPLRSGCRSRLRRWVRLFLPATNKTNIVHLVLQCKVACLSNFNCKRSRLHNGMFCFFNILSETVLQVKILVKSFYWVCVFSLSLFPRSCCEVHMCVNVQSYIFYCNAASYFFGLFFRRAGFCEERPWARTELWDYLSQMAAVPQTQKVCQPGGESVCSSDSFAQNELNIRH